MTRQRWLVLAGIILIGLLLRLALAWGWFENRYDQVSYEITANIVLQGGNVYAETTRYNYSPVWMITLAAIKSFTDSTGLPFHFGVRGFLTLMDLLMLGLVVLTAQKYGQIRGEQALVLHALSPGIIGIVGFHGQFETLALLPVMLAVWWEPKPLLRWLLLTIGIVIKHNLILVVWFLYVFWFRGTKAYIAMLASIIVFLLTFLPFAQDAAAAEGIFRNVFMYTSVPSYFGLSALVPRPLMLVLMLSLVFITPYVFLRRPGVQIMDGWLIAILIWLVFNAGFGVQFMMFPLVVGELNVRNLRWVVLTGTLVLGIQVAPNLFYSYIIHIVLWFICLGWLITNVRAKDKALV